VSRPAPIRQRLYPNCQSFSRQHHCYPQFTAHLQRAEETPWRILDSAWLLYRRRWQPSRDSRRSRRLSEPKPALEGIDETHKRARGGCAPLSGLKIEGFSTAGMPTGDSCKGVSTLKTCSFTQSGAQPFAVFCRRFAIGRAHTMTSCSQSVLPER
jgi:hypothetical protein